MHDELWYAPLASPAAIDEGVALESAYALGNEVQPAQPYTVSLVSACVSADHLKRQGWLPHLLSSNHDILIYSSTTRGSRAPVQRVHLHRSDVDLNKAQFSANMLSDTVHICDDYNGTDDLFIELNVATPSTMRMKSDQTFNSLGQVAGSVGGFPALAPYIAEVKLGLNVLQAVEHLLTAGADDHANRIQDSMRLEPPGTPSAKTIRYGRFVAFSDAVDGTKYRLFVNGRVEGPDLGGISYAVFRIDQSEAPTPDFVLSQRAATLLTGLNHRESGDSGSNPAIDFLKETVQGYSNFKDLQRYHQLKQKPEPTPAELNLMQQMEGRTELQPFLR